MRSGVDDRKQLTQAKSAMREDQDLRPLPRIAIQVFAESADVIHALEQVVSDRRLAKTHSRLHEGGIAAAIDFYASAPTPNLLLIETREGREATLTLIDNLASVCDAGTKVVIIGHINDVLLYRELLRRGVSDYMVAPLDMFDVIRRLGEIFHDEAAAPLGRLITFLPAKGGVGASTLAHNVAFLLSRLYEADVVIADMDLAFGTAALDFNQDPPQGIADAVFSPDRIDEVFLDRVLAKCSEHLYLLAAPASLERTYDFNEDAFAGLLDVARAGVPAVVLDLPAQWSGWVRRTLALADEIVVTATPDLACLRNMKNIVDHLRMLRPNDAPPHYVLNQVGVPKRPEIKAADFVKALGYQPLALIPFEPQLFGTAANNGQMIAEINAKSPVGGLFRHIAQNISGRGESGKLKRNSYRIRSIFPKLSFKKTSIR